MSQRHSFLWSVGGHGEPECDWLLFVCGIYVVLYHSLEVSLSSKLASGTALSALLRR